MDADKVEEGQSEKTEQPKPTASWVHHQNLEGLWAFKTISSHFSISMY